MSSVHSKKLNWHFRPNTDNCICKSNQIFQYSQLCFVCGFAAKLQPDAALSFASSAVPPPVESPEGI